MVLFQVVSQFLNFLNFGEGEDDEKRLVGLRRAAPQAKIVQFSSIERLYNFSHGDKVGSLGLGSRRCRFAHCLLKGKFIRTSPNLSFRKRDSAAMRSRRAPLNSLLPCQASGLWPSSWIKLSIGTYGGQNAV